MELEQIFSVSEFNEFVSQYLSKVGEVTIEGEISELKVSQGKFIFGAIKDEGASVDIFGMTFQITNLSQIEEGMLVKVVGTPRLYEKTGRFSVSVRQIIPSGEGALRRAFEKLKAQLEAEGLFDAARKRPLPRFPQKVGLITAKGSQAYNDFVKVLQQRMGGIDVVFTSVLVQGNDSPRSVVQALNYLNREYKDLDLVVITRGGGSLEDLIGFNDEQVARAIFGSKMPVVSAVGHEGDWSLSDLVADLRASTPSNAAELIVPSRIDVMREIEHELAAMAWIMRDRISAARLVITQFQESLKNNFERSVAAIDDLNRRLSNELTRYIDTIMQYRIQVEGLFRMLNSLDYRSVLKRGFSITYASDGSILRKVDDVSVGSGISTRLPDGVVSSSVSSVKYEHGEK
ncbi:exodeoxyribonuclease VII large subunit [candidate division WWE3 bacterium]|uniref:Exodeoxyribonuclease 7 large subunit n=1 Tax=candidate division WWE3 bacterium TaxID=2053526 RepID=A0A955RRX5_UNCKA|nr:exodeoxyribonuclease VII large subunit [candidate division WWE3 bacterium]